MVKNRFGERLAEGREGHGWSQAVMAEKLGEHGFRCFASTVAKLETNERTLSAEELGAYAAAFGCSADVLLGRQTDPTADRDFALRRLEGSLEEAARQVKLVLRDIDRVADDVGDDQVSAAVAAAYSKLGSGTAALADALVLIGERRGVPRATFRRRRPTPEQQSASHARHTADATPTPVVVPAPDWYPDGSPDAQN